MSCCSGDNNNVGCRSGCTCEHDDEITISRDEYTKLMADSVLLDMLETSSIEQWEGYAAVQAAAKSQVDDFCAHRLCYN